jgi:hypothetical protein
MFFQSRTSSAVNPGSTWGQLGVMIRSIWGQPWVDPGSACTARPLAPSGQASPAGGSLRTSTRTRSEHDPSLERMLMHSRGGGEGDAFRRTRSMFLNQLLPCPVPRRCPPRSPPGPPSPPRCSRAATARTAGCSPPCISGASGIESKTKKQFIIY